MHSSLEGYKTESGAVITAKKDSFITRAPDILFFQLQRVVYDKERGLYKANDTFRFPKEMHIDPFLEKNKEKMNEKANLIKEINDEVPIFE